MGSRARLMAIALCAAALGLGGCVTTKSGGFASKADREQALQTSLQLARSYISRGNWDEAKRHLQYAESVSPNNPETLEALALVFQNTGELETAEEYYLRSIREAPKVMRTRNNYAAFLYEQGRYKEAAEQLEVVTQDLLYEQRDEAFVNLGRCYLKLDQLEGAENAFRRALLMDRSNQQVLLSLAEVFFRQQQFADAQRFFDAYQKQQPTPSAAALWLGIRLADIFDDEDAHASFALALKNLFPKSEEYLLYKAYIQQGDGGRR